MGKVYIAGKNQIKTVTPSNTTQTVTPDNGYNALDAVVVEPIAALMPQTVEDFITRNSSAEPFSININGTVPPFACYQQSRLVAVYGNVTAVGENAFSGCRNLSFFELNNLTSADINSFNGAGLAKVNAPNLNTIGTGCFSSCSALMTVDVRNLLEISTNAFYNCGALLAVDMRNVQRINNSIMSFSGNVLIIDITNSHNAVLNNAGLSSNTNLTILVADATDKAYYQSATNWSTYASKIKTVADFEQEIGKSYDVYYEEVFGHPRFDTQQGA